MKEETITSAWLAIMILAATVFWAALIFLAVKYDKQEKEIERLNVELNFEKQKWADFNKSYIPEIALPRVPKIEAVYSEG